MSPLSHFHTTRTKGRKAAAADRLRAHPSVSSSPFPPFQSSETRSSTERRGTPTRTFSPGTVLTSGLSSRGSKLSRMIQRRLQSALGGWSRITTGSFRQGEWVLLSESRLCFVEGEKDKGRRGVSSGGREGGGDSVSTRLLFILCEPFVLTQLVLLGPPATISPTAVWQMRSRCLSSIILRR